MAETEQSKIRRLRAPSETVREKATKVQEAADKPAKKRLLRSGFSKVATPFRKVGRVLVWIGRHIIPSYIRGAWHELRLVTWPSRRQSRQLTIAVMIFAVIFGVLVAGVDYGLDKVFKQVILNK